MKHVILPAAALVLATNTAIADTALSLILEIGEDSSVSSVVYACDSVDDIAVQYVNAGDNALALMEIDGEDLVFVNVVSASGAKYVSGGYVWWSKGAAATLENTLESGATIQCSET